LKADAVLIPIPAATATAAAVVPATPTTTAAAATGRTLLARSRDVYGDIPSIQRFAVQRGNSALRFLSGAHGDKAEAARTPAHAIDHEISFDNRTVGGKGVVQIVFGGVEGKISYKQFRIHMMTECPQTHFAFSRLFPTAGFQIITETSSTEDLPCLGKS
jgi:hypothetical protein